MDQPTPISNTCISDADYIIALDETGTPELKGISSVTPKHKRYFSLTGVLIDKESINKIASDVIDLKNLYWKNGMFNGHRVVFHSRNIRKKIGPFNPSLIDNNAFNQDLLKLMSDVPLEIANSTIDKLKHKDKYSFPRPVYDLSIVFLLERLTYRLNWLNVNGVILLESRGNKEDSKLLQQIVHILNFGNDYKKTSDFNCIKGVYFNKKWTYTHQKSYWPLELADVLSYSIHKYNISGIKSKELLLIENKIIGYPQYKGKGNKVFPN